MGTFVIKDKNLKPENIKKGVTILKTLGTLEESTAPVPYEEEYLTIESLEDNNTITLYIDYNFDNYQTIYYSKDKQTWSHFTGEWSSDDESYVNTVTVTLNSNEKLYIYNVLAETYYYSNFFKITGNKTHKVSGNILSLMYGQDFKNKTHIIPKQEWYDEPYWEEHEANCFEKLFENDSYLTDASNLILPNDIVPKCYKYMFQGCTSLVNAPVLPATNLEIAGQDGGNSCYQSMFEGCTSLVNAPVLPATTLAFGCYQTMFYGCTSLVNAPALPATTLATGCYSSMFQGCTSLVNAPALPATTLSRTCYKSMFNGCTSLKEAKEVIYDQQYGEKSILPATTLAFGCYETMFYGCTNFRPRIINLPATTLATDCYKGMFQGCSLFYTTINMECTVDNNTKSYLIGMFKNTKLTYLPIGRYNVPLLKYLCDSSVNAFEECHYISAAYITYTDYQDYDIKLPMANQNFIVITDAYNDFSVNIYQSDGEGGWETVSQSRLFYDYDNILHSYTDYSYEYYMAAGLLYGI